MAKSKEKKSSSLWRIETVLMGLFSTLKLNIEDYCELETTDGGANIVLKNGTLITLIEYEGTKTIISNEVFHQMIARLTSSLSGFFSKKGHQLGMVFKRDLNATSELFKIANMQKQTAKALDLKLDFLIDEAVNIYSKYVYDESCYIVMITQPMVLDSAEQALEQKKKMALRKEYSIPAMAYAQNILLPISFLRAQHETFVDRLLTEFKNPEFSIQATKLNVAEALFAIKQSVSPNTTNPEWRPFTPGSKSPIPLRWKTNDNEHDLSHVLYPTLPEQIMKQVVSGAESKSTAAAQYPTGSVITDGRIYSPLMVDIPPQLGHPFSELFKALDDAKSEDEFGNERSMPYAVSFMLSGDGMAGIGVKSALASLLAVASANNANVKAAASALNAYNNQGGTIVGLQISAMTWANNTEFGLDQIQIRRSKLWRILEGWGLAQVMEKGGDPILGWRTNIPGLSLKHHAPKCPAPLYDALAMLPLVRQASPFKHGTVLSRSVDGKLMRFEKFSSEQTTWITIYQGRPGSGKSVAMNNDVLEACLMPGLKRLPLIFMIDVGISSRGPVDLLKDHLPPEKQHLAVYKRMRNDITMSINPLDCAVGLMKPLIGELGQMTSFITSLVTAREADGKAETGMSSFANQVIEAAFIAKMEGTERGNPNRYEKHRSPELDQLCADLNVDPTKKSYYTLEWEFHKKGDTTRERGKCYRARDLCHRYAMPTLNDLSAAVNSDDIKARYSTASTAQGELLINVFTRALIEAIKMYPVFADFTKFDLDTARVVSLDLQDVIGTNAKQTSLFFQIARIFSKKRLAYTADDLKDFPDFMRPYYTRLIEELAEDKKMMCYDELHNAKRDEILFAELERDGREARKWGMELCLASQVMADFGRMTEFATRFVIADRGTSQSREFLVKNIELKPVEEKVMSESISLSSAGLTYLSRVVCKGSSYVSLITLTIGPQRLWALTTDADERLLRQNLYDTTNDRPFSLYLLAMFHPGGGKKEINRRKEQSRAKISNEDFNIDDELDSITRDMAKEMLEAYYSQQRQKNLEEQQRREAAAIKGVA